MLLLCLLATRQTSQISGGYPCYYLKKLYLYLVNSGCRQITLEEATKLSEELGIMFMETSAKAGHNVKSLFKKIALSLPGMEKEGAAADAENNSKSRSSKSS